MKFDLKSEISDGKNLVIVGRKTFLHARERGASFGANFGENIGNFVSNVASFFGTTVQKKGAVKCLCCFFFPDLRVIYLDLARICWCPSKKIRKRKKKATGEFAKLGPSDPSEP